MLFDVVINVFFSGITITTLFFVKEDMFIFEFLYSNINRVQVVGGIILIGKC
jgi:hypothetical protein